MPLKGVLNGAKQCQVLTKRTRQRCKNPAAYGCVSCRMHGAHKSRNVLQGAMHPQYRNAGHTKIERQKRSDSSLQFALLEQLGWSLNMFTGTKTRGRKPSGYSGSDLSDPDQLSEIILKTISKSKLKD